MTKPEAGKSLVTRRKAFVGAAAGAVAALGLIAASGPAAAKSKKAAGYQSKPNGSQRCGGCIHFSGGRCDVVSGGVSANGWCKLFTG